MINFYKLQNALKELKTKTSNEKGFQIIILQSDQVLAQLKATDGHATQNVFKRRKTLERLAQR